LMEKRSPAWLRILEIIAGVVLLPVAILVVADSAFVLTVLAYTIGFGLLVLGLSRVFAGVFGRYFAPWFRELNAGGGLVAIVLGIVILIVPQTLIGLLALLVAFALLIVGVVEIVAGGFAKHPPAWVRALIAAVGVLTVGLSVFLILDPPSAEIGLAIIVAIVLVAVGLRDIVHGVTGHRPVNLGPVTVTKV
jgi:uncharacterized membrane protein HdeD (DUF308 family)